MSLSSGRNLWGLIRKSGIRHSADYVRPKFKGGPAKPHEIGKFIRQSLYEHGERVVGIVGFFIVVPLAFIYLPFSKHRQERNQYIFENYRTSYVYPYPKRAEE
ncbi:uncharacterized protein LOC120331577 [Styela clava]|uniref:uncharacterized protein LOC120331577 n=1 Tax=Styela clava TaxID=7725 RepID=UPI0019399580|nr:uncharacterized protein LOC120331577 [Styela clava]